MTNIDSLTNLGGAIVLVALVTTVVSRPNSANVLKAAGEAFSSSLKAAMGR